MASPIRVLIADDDELVREGLRAVLAYDERLKLVAVVSNGRDAVEHCLHGTVDVALLDARMPILDGPDACARITTDSRTRVCILSTFDDADLVSRAIASGASGYLLKGIGGEELRETIRLLHRGHTIFRSSVFQSFRATRVRGDLSMLSEREAEIARQIARGLSNRDIAARLHLSEGTVKNYISSALSKLGLTQRTQIAVYCLGPEELDRS